MSSPPKQIRCRIERTWARLNLEGIDGAVDEDDNVEILGISNLYIDIDSGRKSTNTIGVRVDTLLKSNLPFIAACSPVTSTC